MSVISRFSAVTKVNDKIKFTGLIAWVTWLAVHLFYLVGFRNRFVAVASWLIAFIGTGRPGFAEVEKATSTTATEERRAA
jgi:NADH dehydrogenase